jgi:hypothetical protein
MVDPRFDLSDLPPLGPGPPPYDHARARELYRRLRARTLPAPTFAATIRRLEELTLDLEELGRMLGLEG